MTKQDAAIVPRFHALDGKETVKPYRCCTAEASLRMRFSANVKKFLSWTSMLTLANIDTQQFLVNNLSRTK
jgi:hypothetical protein